jgi:hypothetical protein
VQLFTLVVNAWSQAVESVAAIWMDAQATLVRELRRDIVHSNVQVLVFSEHISWDESKQSLVVDFGKEYGLGRDDCRSSWNVMVVDRVFEWLPLLHTPACPPCGIFVCVVVISYMCSALFDIPSTFCVAVLVRSSNVTGWSRAAALVTG